MERIKAGEYLYNLLRRSFKSTVRIMVLVMLAVVKFKERLLRNQIGRKEKTEEDLKLAKLKDPLFTAFTIRQDPDRVMLATAQAPPEATQITTKINLAA